MIYKFKTKSSGDVIMTAEVGDRVLRAAGREPSAQGIFEPAAMSAAIEAMERAVAEEDAGRAEAERKAAAEGVRLPPPGVTLRQRVWPLIEMMRRAQAAGHPIVWGV